jgi:hypothetical protein
MLGLVSIGGIGYSFWYFNSELGLIKKEMKEIENIPLEKLNGAIDKKLEQIKKREMVRQLIETVCRERYSELDGNIQQNNQAVIQLEGQVIKINNLRERAMRELIDKQLLQNGYGVKTEEDDKNPAKLTREKQQ